MVARIEYPGGEAESARTTGTTPAVIDNFNLDVEASSSRARLLSVAMT